MTTWYTETFRGQILWDLSKGIKWEREEWLSFVSRMDLQFDGGYAPETPYTEEKYYPEGHVRELVKPSNPLHKEFMSIFYDSYAKTPAPRKQGIILKSLKQPKFEVGLPAIYHLYAKIAHTKDWTFLGDSYQANKWVKEYISYALTTTAYNMKTKPHVIEEALKRVDWRAITVAEQWLNLAAMFRNLITMRWHRTAIKMQRGEQPLANMNGVGRLRMHPDWTIYFDAWITVIIDNEQDAAYLLTTVDIDRMQALCVSTAMQHLHLATFPVTAGNTDAHAAARQLHRKVYSIIVSAMEKADLSTSQTLCRDMKKAFQIYLSMAAGALSEEGTAELRAEFRREKYGASFDSRKYIDALCNAPFDIAQDFGRLFKMLPCPDYDIGASFHARYTDVMNPNPAEEITGDNPCNYTEFRQYMRKLIIVTIMKQRGPKGIGKLKTTSVPPWWQAYKEHGRIPNGLDWTDVIDLTGVAKYVERTVDSPASYKDTSAAEEDIYEALETNPDAPYKRNMLLRYLFDPNCPTEDRARAGLGRSIHVHRLGFKMEAHKTKARGFYIGNMQDRLVQSEIEENIHRIASDCPGYMIGQNTEFSVRKIMHMVAPQLAPDERVFYLNFDLKGWSPGMRSEPQVISHEVWAEVFDRPHIATARKINEGAVVILNKRGYVGAYINPVANFEGYNGKEMTFLHCALMGYSVMRYNRQYHEKRAVELCAFIDDGLATFREKLDRGATTFLNFVQTVSDTYNSLGYILEKSKCYLSDIFAIFLNEIYYMGRHITYGLRAVMRIGTSMPEQYETIFEKLNARAAGCQGAMKAGMDLLAAYIVYLHAASRVLREYGIMTKMDGKAAALYTYTPKVFGGLGQPTLLVLASNYSSDSLADGISAIQHMTKVYPAYKEAVYRLLTQDIQKKTEGSILLAPRTVKPAEFPITESRLKQAIASALLKKPLTPRAKKTISLGKDYDLQALGEAVVGSNLVLVETLIQDIKDATPFSLLQAMVSKFQNARTMVQLLGRGTLKRITYENRRDVLLSIAHFKSRIR
jgi:hypothetical protein